MEGCSNIWRDPNLRPWNKVCHSGKMLLVCLPLGLKDGANEPLSIHLPIVYVYIYICIYVHIYTFYTYVVYIYIYILMIMKVSRDYRKSWQWKRLWVHVKWSKLGIESPEFLPGWWARATPLKNMSSSIGMIRTPIYGKIELMAIKPPTSYSFEVFTVFTKDFEDVHGFSLSQWSLSRINIRIPQGIEGTHDFFVKGVYSRCKTRRIFLNVD